MSRSPINKTSKGDGLDKLHSPQIRGATAASISLEDLVKLYRSGQFSEIANHYRSIVRGLPDSADRLNISGAAFHAMGRYSEAEICFSEALLFRRDAKLENNLGNALRAQGRHMEAIAHYQRALQMEPEFAEAHNNLGNSLKDTGRIEESLEQYDKAISLRPKYEEAKYNKANALQALGELQAAEMLYNKILADNPRMGHARNNLAKMLLEAGKPLEAYNHLLVAVELMPNSAEVLNNLGNSLRDLRRFEDASTHYRKAIAINPSFTSSKINLGSILIYMGMKQEAEYWFRMATADGVQSNLALAGHAIALEALGRGLEAIQVYRRAIELDPMQSETYSKLVHLSAEQCDWSHTTEDLTALQRLEETGKVTFPFAMLAFNDDPETALLRARRFTEKYYPQRDDVAPNDLRVRAKQNGRITIGYFSADFRDHVIGRLIVRILELHDRSRFKVIAYDQITPSDHKKDDAVRRRIMATVDSFVPLEGLDDREAAQRARVDGVDIAIDLTGYTTGGRSGIFAHRAAPIQISYLGFPGTMGAPFYDYIIADRHIIPETERRFYDERVMYMPGSYLVADDSLSQGSPTISRESLGVLDDDFLFCCFNAPYKINAGMLDVWCRILANVPNGKILLYAKNENIKSRLRAAFEERSLASDRVAFVGPQGYNDYRANYQLVDLFLDTFPYNANATAIDALSVGVPVITMEGRNLIARAAAGLLRSLDMPELITHSPDEYVAKVIAVATTRGSAAQLGSRIKANATRSGLFDTSRFTRDLEARLTSAFQRHEAGLPPTDIHG